MAQETKWREEHQEIADEYIEYILDNLPEQKILVQGVTLDFSLPSEGRFRVNGVRKVEGREIKEDVGIFTTPTRFRNKFKNLRRKFYKLLAECAFILGKGEGNRNFYLIPLQNVQRFLDGVREIEEEFKELEDEINRYFNQQTTDEERKFLQNVQEYIEEQEKVFHSTSLFSLRAHLNFDISLMPLRIDTATFMDIATDQVKQEMDRALKQLKDEFSRTRRRIIEKMVSDLHSRFSRIMQKLAQAAETKYAPRYDSMRAAVEETTNLAKTVNLDWLISDLAEACDATALVLSRKKYDEKELEKATSLIAKALRLPSADKPIEILKKATYNLETMDERLRALVTRM